MMLSPMNSRSAAAAQFRSFSAAQGLALEPGGAAWLQVMDLKARASQPTPRADEPTAAGGSMDKPWECLTEFAHDMRTPLACIVALSDQVSACGQAGAGLAERLRSHAWQLMRMMDGFIAQTQAQASTVSKTERLLQDLLEESREQVLDLSVQRGVNIVLEHSATCYFVQVSCELMVRALNNVLVNAIKYGEPGSSIRIQCRSLPQPDGVAVVVEVTNQIATLPSDLVPITRSCGLGLDFVRKVVSLHGGQLDLDLPETGLARVRLQLPCDIETL